MSSTTSTTFDVHPHDLSQHRIVQLYAVHLDEGFEVGPQLSGHRWGADVHLGGHHTSSRIAAASGQWR